MGVGGIFFGVGCWSGGGAAAQPRKEPERQRRRSEPTRSECGAATNFPLGKFGLRPLLMGSFGVGTVLLDGTVS